MNIEFTSLLKKKNWTVTGRASSAIYLILKSRGISNSDVLVPSNICYAAVYPVVFSNNNPVFMDICDDGNVNLKNIIDKYNPKVKVVIVPHMYGNPVKEIEQISKFCIDNGIILIEDCASAIGAKINNRFAGEFGEYSIFSFGYSKIIDLGNGGLILTNNDIKDIINLEEKFPMYNNNTADKLKFFSEFYRVIRNNKENDFIKKVFEEIPNYYRDAFLYSIDEKLKEKVIKSLEDLSQIVEIRKAKNNIYMNNIKVNQYVEIFKNDETGVPWRFNILIDKAIRKDFINYLLKNNVPVSDWYPVVSSMFNIENTFLTASYIEDRIINFPIAIDNEEIIRICDMFNKYFE